MLHLLGEQWHLIKDGPAPCRLPDCEVLQLDCEGSELEILRDLTIEPGAVLVETHGVFGAPMNIVASLLDKAGYLVSDLAPAEPRFGGLHTIEDVRVLPGILRDR